MIGIDLYRENGIIVLQELRGEPKDLQWWNDDFGIFLQGYSAEENNTWRLAIAIHKTLMNDIAGFKCGPRFQHVQFKLGSAHISMTHVHLAPTRRIADYIEPLAQVSELRNPQYKDILIGDTNAKITLANAQHLHKARFANDLGDMDFFHKTGDPRGAALTGHLLSERYQWAQSAHSSHKHTWTGPRGQQAQLDHCFIQDWQATHPTTSKIQLVSSEVEDVTHMTKESDHSMLKVQMQIAGPQRRERLGHGRMWRPRQEEEYHTGLAAMAAEGHGDTLEDIANNITGC